VWFDVGKFITPRSKEKMRILAALFVVSLSALAQQGGQTMGTSLPPSPNGWTGDAKLTKLRTDAEAVSSIGAFVDKYLGDCGMLGGADCEKSAEAFRKVANGKKFYMIVNEGSANVLQMGEVLNKNGGFILNLTPFFPGSNSALTHGSPTRADADGNPVIPFLRIDSVLPDGWNPGMVARQISAQAMRIQIVYTPQDIWTLNAKGKKVKGIKAKFEAVVVTVGRTGEKIGAWYAGK
jgi:hypothetical protein